MEGLAICIELRIQRKNQYEVKLFQNKLCSFCEHFDYPKNMNTKIHISKNPRKTPKVISLMNLKRILYRTHLKLTLLLATNIMKWDRKLINAQ